MKISIRPVRIEDAESVQQYCSDELVARTTNIPRPYPKDGGESFVKDAVKGWKSRQYFKFAITLDNEMVGSIDLNNPDYQKNTVQCDYAIISSHWGRGIATKAIGLALSYAFRELDMNRVMSACLDRNPASRRVLEKNGFVEIRKLIYNNNKFKDEPARSFELTKKIG